MTKPYTRLSYFWLGFLAVCAFVLLSGCQIFSSSDASPEGAQDAINKARSVNIVVIQEANYQFENGVLTKEEHAKYLRQVKDNRDKLDAAQTLLDSGEWKDARSRAELIRKALLVLQKEIHEKAQAAKGEPTKRTSP